MNSKRYLPVGDDVYVDQYGPRQYEPGPWARRAAVASALFLSIVWAMYVPMSRRRPNARRVTCQSNLKQVALAIRQYSEDNDDKLPLVRVNNLNYSRVAPYAQSYGWADALYPYLKSTQVYWCPDDKAQHSADATQQGFTSYWFNGHLNDYTTTHLRQPEGIFLLGDGDVGDARSALTAWPAEWMDELDGSPGPPRRHLGGANYAYADGHAKWLQPPFETSDCTVTETSWDCGAVGLTVREAGP